MKTTLFKLNVTQKSYKNNTNFVWKLTGFTDNDFSLGTFHDLHYGMKYYHSTFLCNFVITFSAIY